MNILQAFVYLGMIILLMTYAVSPIAGTASNINDTAGLTGWIGFFFGNLTFDFWFIFICVVFLWMWGGSGA